MWRAPSAGRGGRCSGLCGAGPSSRGLRPSDPSGQPGPAVWQGPSPVPLWEVSRIEPHCCPPTTRAPTRVADGRPAHFGWPESVSVLRGVQECLALLIGGGPPARLGFPRGRPCRHRIFRSHLAEGGSPVGPPSRAHQAPVQGRKRVPPAHGHFLRGGPGDLGMSAASRYPEAQAQPRSRPAPSPSARTAVHSAAQLARVLPEDMERS